MAEFFVNGRTKNSSESVLVLASFSEHQHVDVLLGTENIPVNRGAVDACLQLLRAGGDFADGVIVFEGMALDSAIFVSFDKKAVSLLKKQGRGTQHLR